MRPYCPLHRFQNIHIRTFITTSPKSSIKQQWRRPRPPRADLPKRRQTAPHLDREAFLTRADDHIRNIFRRIGVAEEAGVLGAEEEEVVEMIVEARRGIWGGMSGRKYTRDLLWEQGSGMNLC